MRKTHDAIESFFTQYTALKVKKGTVLMHAGEEPKGVYFLRSGYIKQYALSDNGNPIFFHIFHPGSFFPLSWVLNNEVPSSVHETMSAVSLYRAPKDAVIAFLKTNPEILYQTAQRLMGGLIGLTKRIETLIDDEAEEKTIRFLLYLAQTIGERKADEVVIPIAFPHREIASWIGTTRETASLQMEKLKKQNRISYVRNQIVIHDIGLLKNVN